MLSKMFGLHKLKKQMELFFNEIVILLVDEAWGRIVT